MATDQQVKIIINGQDKSKPAFASASSSVSGLSKGLVGMSKVVAGGLLAAGAGLTAFLYSSAKAAGDAQVQMARVTATLESMGDAAVKNKGAILEAADAAVKLGFDDEDAAESITKLYQRTNDITEAMKLNTLAMDYARAKHVELSEATQVVSMALSGGGRALKDFGIEISDSLTPMEALAELQKRVSGQADEFAGTFSGQVQILSLEFNNLKETIGGALLEAIMPFIKQLSEWAAKKETQAKIKEISNLLREWAEVIIPVVIDVFKMWIDWGTKLYDILIKIGNAIMVIVDSMNNLGKNGTGGIKGLTDAWKNAGSNLSWAASGGIPGRAAGGPVSSGSPYIVGENGPELFVPAMAGNIIPNGRGMGGGSITINISGNTLLDDNAGEKIGNQIMRTLKMQMRI